ncbi:DUF305 domain-containing protein [Plantactinospora sp. B5E13]|uniref:DUF305 domain-containing protein n=1 Tax=unclassified Plantactinospora TaxID=2631981 RepID=UPI00325E49BE
MTSRSETVTAGPAELTTSAGPAESTASGPAGSTATGPDVTGTGEPSVGEPGTGGPSVGGPGGGDVADGPGRRGPGTGLLALGVVLGLVLGLAAGLLAPNLFKPGDDSAEAGFARDMSTHHAQAVEMSILAHERATDPDVRTLAADIALTQQAQIGTMQTWLKTWGLNPTGSQPRMAWMPEGTAMVRNGLMPGMATDQQRTELRAATGRDFDVLFLKLMLDHHIGGIHMAEAVTEASDDDQVTALAQSMINGQQKEIQLIQSLLGKLGAR